jgi:hypothetical protein
MSEKRQSPRTKCNQKVRVTWTDASGLYRTMQGRCVDVSNSGIRLEVPERLEQRIFVQLQDELKKLNGTACVRYCTGGGRRYIAGLEFSGGLRWQG